MSLTFRCLPLAVALMLSTTNLSFCGILTASDQKNWLSYEKRKAIAQNLVDTSSLIGTTATEIKTLLGPTHINYLPPIQMSDVYALELHPHEFRSATKFFSVPGLEIHYHLNRVTSVKIAPCNVPNLLSLPGAGIENE